MARKRRRARQSYTTPIKTPGVSKQRNYQVRRLNSVRQTARQSYIDTDYYDNDYVDPYDRRTIQHSRSPYKRDNRNAIAVEKINWNMMNQVLNPKVIKSACEVAKDVRRHNYFKSSGSGIKKKKVARRKHRCV